MEDEDVWERKILGDPDGQKGLIFGVTLKNFGTRSDLNFWLLYYL